MWPRTKRSALFAFSSSLLFGCIRTGRRSVRKDVSGNCVGKHTVGHFAEDLSVGAGNVQAEIVCRDRGIRDTDNAARILIHSSRPGADTELVPREGAAVERHQG